MIDAVLISPVVSESSALSLTFATTVRVLQLIQFVNTECTVAANAGLQWQKLPLIFADAKHVAILKFQQPAASRPQLQVCSSATANIALEKQPPVLSV